MREPYLGNHSYHMPRIRQVNVHLSSGAWSRRVAEESIRKELSALLNYLGAEVIIESKYFQKMIDKFLIKADRIGYPIMKGETIGIEVHDRVNEIMSNKKNYEMRGCG
jgi:hypothetical protein